MDDLFEQLKAAPPVNTITPITDAMLPPKTPALKKANYQKTVGSDQLLVEKSIKPVKVLIERKKFNAIGSMLKTSQSAASETISTKASVKAIPKKFEPTITKQKHLPKTKTEQQLTKIRRCFVKLPKRNFFLQRLNVEQSTKLKTLVPNGRAKTGFVKNNSKSGNLKRTDLLKRKHVAEPVESFISSKRGKMSPKYESFFAKIKKNQKKKSMSLNKCVPSPSIAPTKFPRSKLVEDFGKRFFQSHVRIEKVKHPMMVVFESNARASLELARANRKSKNLSVSFLGQVEIFGESSSDDDDENDEKDDTASTSREETPNPPKVTPVRLNQGKNGKEVDKIESNSTEFILGSGEFDNSTPTVVPKTNSPKRKEKKSYSPLKQDSPMSPRKEALKKANEVLPRGYQHFNDDENDEGEENSVEYIVPIEMPERRLSRKKSVIPNTSNKTIIDDSEDTILPDADTKAVSPTADQNKLSKQSRVKEDKSAYTSVNETIDDNFPVQLLEPLIDNQQIVESPTNSHDTDFEEIEEAIVSTVDECIATVSDDNEINSSSISVLPENTLATILDDSLERVLPSSVNSNRGDSSPREDITASVLPEIPPNTFDNLFDDGDVFIPNLQFSPERSNQNLVEKSTLSTIQDIMNEQEKLQMPEVLLTDEQSIPSANTILKTTTTSSFNLSEAPAPIPVHIRTSASVSPKLTDSGKSTFSRIVNSMKNIITQSRSSAD